MPKHKQTLDEIAREEDEKVAQGRETEGYVRVPGNAGKAGHVMMLRLSQEEMAAVRSAAEAQGMDVLEFVRLAVMGAARSQAEGPTLIKQVQAKVRELADAVEKL